MLWWKIIYKIFARVETAFRLLANYIQRLLKKNKLLLTSMKKKLLTEEICILNKRALLMHGED
jgi:hypothetical protein